MSYKDLYEKASKEGSIEEMSATYKEWKEEGEVIVGEFVATNKVASSLGAKEYNQYLFKTDDGLTKFHLGAITDSEVAPLLVRGRVYAIEYEGKRKISNSRQVNQFKVTRVVMPDEADTVSQETAPF